MKIRSFIVTLALFVFGAVFVVSAQNIVVIEGVKYTIHDVAKGETLYSLARTYGVTVDEIKAANNSLADGLKAGTRIKIPAKVASRDTAAVPPKSQMHKVAKGETLYSLAKQNNLTIEELRAANPHIKKGLKAGQVIEIPFKAAQPVAEQTPAPQTSTPQAPAPQTPAPQAEVVATPQPNEPQNEIIADGKHLSSTSFRTLQPNDTAEVALLLPLGTEEHPAQNYIDFYRGFLVGLDSVRMSGRSINLNLYNTAHDYNRIEQIISSGALDNANLVVGPIYEDELIPVATALRRRHIPIVSPLANLVQTTSNSVFQMSPSPATKLEKVRDMFDGSKRVVIISTENIDAEFDAEVRSMLNSNAKVVEHKYLYEHPSIIEKREKEREKMREAGLEVDNTPSPSDMSPLLRGEEPTVIVITASNELDVDRILAAIASANIALTARSQRVVPFVVFGNNRWNRYNNIDRAILFANNVTMLSTYHARRSEPIIRAFDKRFVEEFGALPSLYAYRGYDAAVVFVNSLYGAMETGLEGAHSMPLLTPYTFEQNPASGIRVNNQWIKVNYNSNFTITTE